MDSQKCKELHKLGRKYLETLTNRDLDPHTSYANTRTPNPHRHTVTTGTQTHRELDSDRDRGENTGWRERELGYVQNGTLPYYLLNPTLYVVYSYYNFKNSTEKVYGIS